MRRCFSCGGRLSRIRRAFRERFLYSAVYKCRDCGMRRTEDQWYLFLFGKASRCPRCGTHRVQKLKRVDHIDKMYKNPFSYLQKYFGGQLHYCIFCRVQFYDLRPRAAAEAAPVTDTAKSDG